MHSNQPSRSNWHRFSSPSTTVNFSFEVSGWAYFSGIFGF